MDAEGSCTMSLLFVPHSSVQTWGADLYSLQQWALMTSRFWLGLANGRQEKEIKGWEKSEVGLVILLIPSLLGPYGLAVSFHYKLHTTLSLSFGNHSLPLPLHQALLLLIPECCTILCRFH